MFIRVLVPLLAISALFACQKPPAQEAAAKFTDVGELQRPDATDWVFVSASAAAVADQTTAGNEMMAAGNETAAAENAPKEGEAAPVEKKQPEGRINVIRIDPAAWEAYRKTGEFPEGTVFAMAHFSMDDRAMAASRYWADKPIGMEFSVKDSKRFPDGWAYFLFKGDEASMPAMAKDKCFDCHQAKGAHDNVFTQLYEAFSAAAQP
jgi:Cytochrome P460